MKIVLLEDLAVRKERLEKERDILASRGHEFVWFERTADEGKLKDEAADADVIMLANMPLSKEVLSAAKNLKYIDVAFTGVDHIPVKAALARGIEISNASGYADDAVAELVMAEMIESLRRLPELQKRGKDGQAKTGIRGSLIKGKTVGIIGAGHIGRRVAQLCKAFGCRVLGYNRSEITDPNFDGQTSLENVLKESDIVSIHLPLTESTEHLIGKDELALMKKGALLINTARGKVVDEQALVDVLNEDRIIACIDVYDKEPPLDEDDPILTASNCILTPHIGFDSVDSMEARANIVFDNLYSWLDGTLKNAVH